MKKLLALCLAAAFAAVATVQTTTAADDKPAATEKKARSIPFRGKMDAIDKNARTIKVGERTFQLTSQTRIVKAGKPATLDDATLGDDVGGAYHEGEGGKLEVVSLRLGPKPEAPKKEEKK